MLRYEGKGYPPKLVLSVASEIATGQTLPSAAFITTEAERFLLRLGFSVIRTGQQSARDDKEGTRSAPPLVVSDLSSKEIAELGQKLVYSSRLYRWSELKNNPTLPPRLPGVYAWFFERVPPTVPVDSCVVRDESTTSLCW